jgi:hypothetical protein
MKINIDAPITNLEGTQLKEKDKLLTLKDYAVNAVLSDQRDQTAEDKVKSFALATKIFNGSKEFSPEEVVIIKKRIGEIYSSLIVGQCEELLK